MQVGRSLWNSIQDRVATDTAFLASATANKVYLVVSSFVPTLDLDISTLTLASFTGSGPLSATIGAADVYYDPITGNRRILVSPPIGGWNWICTATPTPAQTVYGWILTDNAGTGLLISGLLPTPVPISAAGQGVTIAEVRIDFATSQPT